MVIYCYLYYDCFVSLSGVNEMQNRQLKEKKAHGTPSLPLITYEPWRGRIDKHYEKVGYHWHDEWEICVIDEGTVLCGLNRDTHIISTGTIVFIPGGHFHFLDPVNNNHWLYRSVVFGQELLHLSSHELGESKYIRPFLDSQNRTPSIIRSMTAIEIFNKLYTVVKKKPPFYELHAKACLLEILALWMEQSETDDTSQNASIQKENKNTIKYVLEHVHNNYNQQLSLSQLSELANMSKGYFIKLFRRFTGKSPTEYILKFRLSKAAALLSETDAKLIAISLDTGFNNLSYFVRAFQKHYQCSPNDYRQKFKHD